MPPSLSPSKVRRLSGTTSVAITPPNSAKGFESNSSLASPKQSENASNPTTTTSSKPAPNVSKLSYPVCPSDLVGMSPEDRLKLHDPERSAEVERRNRELRDEMSKMSRAEWDQWRIDNGQEHSKIISTWHSVTEANIARSTTKANPPLRQFRPRSSR